jgi:hypothetical protein
MAVQPTKRTVILSEEANEYLGTVVPRRVGHGRFLSGLLLRHKDRQRLEERVKALATIEQWEQEEGSFVD